MYVYVYFIRIYAYTQTKYKHTNLQQQCKQVLQGIFVACKWLSYVYLPPSISPPACMTQSKIYIFFWHPYSFHLHFHSAFFRSLFSVCFRFFFLYDCLYYALLFFLALLTQHAQIVCRV